MIGFVIALKSESKYFLEKLTELKQIKLADKESYLGKINNRDCVVVISGIGKVNAGLATQLLIDKFSLEFIVNFGTCGGMNSSVEILKYYAVEKCCQFDFDLRELDPVPLGYIQDYDRVFFPAITKGVNLPVSACASADRFTNDINDINSINDMGCSLRDMECGAIGQVCLSNNVPLYVIKGITDVYGSQTAQEQFYFNLTTVCKGFSNVILDAVKDICKQRA